MVLPYQVTVEAGLMNGQLREITKETITQNSVKAKRPLS
jgi:hypothetical protein